MSVFQLKQQTISGMIWSFIEKFGSLLLLFISNIVLARLLSPKDFGIIGLISIFIAVSNTLIDAGFGAALVQKEKIKIEDYSTIFIINIIISTIIFIVLYFSSTTISVYFNEILLGKILKILGIAIILNALSIVQNAQLIRAINFKLIAKINLFSTLLAVILSIAAAIIGLGVWSLVIQIMAISFLKTIFLWFSSKWRPKLNLDFHSAKELLNFGYKLLFSGLLDTVYVSVFSLIIGKKYSTIDLGFYTQAKKTQDIPINTISGVINQVTFPIFSKFQNDDVFLKNGLRKSLVSLAYIVMPILVILIIIAPTLFRILFTDKWNDSVPYFQLLCLSGMLLTSHTINLNLLKSKGRTDLYLFSEILKKVIGIISLIIGLFWGIYGIIISIVFTAYISFFINAYFTNKVIDYSIGEQIKDIAPVFLLSIFIGVFIFIISKYIFLSQIVLIVFQTLIYITLYLNISRLVHYGPYYFYKNMILEKITQFKKKYIK